MIDEIKYHIALIVLVVLYEIIRWGVVGVYRDIKLLIRELKKERRARTEGEKCQE